MAIVKMSKFNLIFFENKRDDLLETLQQFKYVHFLNLTENETLKEMSLNSVPVEHQSEKIDDMVRKTSFIIDCLHKFDTRQKGFKQLKEGLTTYSLLELEAIAETIKINEVYETVKNVIEEKERIEREINQLQTNIEKLSMWETIDLPLHELTTFNQSETKLGVIPTKLFTRFKEDILETNMTYYEKVNEDSQHTYIIVVSHKEERATCDSILLNNGFSEMQFNYFQTPTDVITQLHQKILEYKEVYNTYEKNLANIAVNLHEYELLYDYLIMKKTRFSASENFLKTDKLHIMEGYIPTKYETEFEKTINYQLGDLFYLHVEEAHIDDEEVPILLENNKVFQPFESVTEMYALPKYNEIDPTPWFSLFYALFFGMMIGDAGYGLLMFIITFVILKLIILSKEQQSFFRFFYYLSFSTIIWGGIFGSFFGDLFSLPALIDTGEQHNFLLTLSIVLGIIHVFFALAIQAYMEIKRKNLLNALFDVGFWYMLLGGGIVYLLALFLPRFVSYQSYGFIVMITGMIGILLTGGRDSKGFGGKVAGGLYSLYGVSSYISDFVSYSRLMALALASGFIAYAINLMTLMLFDLGVIGIIFGIIVFVIGQGFNIFLSILSSYVHTLRLTYVEFFGKFYEGGGKPFQTFRNASKYINIK